MQLNFKVLITLAFATLAAAAPAEDVAPRRIKLKWWHLAKRGTVFEKFEFAN